jgi:hypothetical protein
MAVLVNGMQAVLQFTQEAQILQNVLNFIRFGGFTDEEVVSVAEDLITWWNDELKTDVPSEVALTQVRARRLDEEDSPIFEVSTGLPLAGTASGPLPNNVTLAVKTLTGLGGRRRRGRVYHVGLRTGKLLSTDVNRIDPGSLSGILDAYRALRDFSFSVADTSWCVWSRISGQGTVITEVASDGVVDSQRRRLPGRGS